MLSFGFIRLFVLIAALTAVDNRVYEHRVALKQISDNDHYVLIAWKLRALEALNGIPNEGLHSHLGLLAEFLVSLRKLLK